jgi:hypothetical protein
VHVVSALEAVPAPEPAPIEVRYEDTEHRYWLRGGTLTDPGWVEVPSVTTALGAMSSKDALPWWAMRVGMAAVVEMMRHVSWAEIANAHEPAEIISPTKIPAERQVFSARDFKRERPKSRIEAWAVDAKRTTNHISDEAAERGESIHKIPEDLALGLMPDVNRFPVEHRGWVAGVMQWWLDQEPSFLLNEVIVGSTRHRYAGRFDMIVYYEHRDQVVLTDLKTSKGVYKSHLRQLPLYLHGFEEMGLRLPEPFAGRSIDALEVLHVTEDGRYALVPSLYRPEHVLPTIDAYHADREGWLLHKDVKGLWEEVK